MCVNGRKENHCVQTLCTETFWLCCIQSQNLNDMRFTVIHEQMWQISVQTCFIFSIGPFPISSFSPRWHLWRLLSNLAGHFLTLWMATDWEANDMWIINVNSILGHMGAHPRLPPYSPQREWAFHSSKRQQGTKPRWMCGCNMQRRPGSQSKNRGVVGDCCRVLCWLAETWPLLQ